MVRSPCPFRVYVVVPSGHFDLRCFQLLRIMGLLGDRCKTLHVGRHQKHQKWSRHVSPAVTVSSGDVVTFDAIDGSNGQIDKQSDKSVFNSFDFELADPVFGPVFIRDAEPGDVLRIDVLSLEMTDWGWSAIMPGFGLLADEFPDPDLKIWNLRPETGYAVFKDGVHIPLRPFLGIMGVAPAMDGEFSTIPPTDAGGNVDCRDLTVGTSVYLPVFVPGALFSCGDGHAAQGHGEVCGTAIETPLKATLRFNVCKNQPWVTAPHYQTAPETIQIYQIADRGRYTTMGIDSDLLEAAKKAVRYMIQWLVATKGLCRNDAYMLASVAADLQIAELVDVPNFAVTMSLPLNVFV